MPLSAEITHTLLIGTAAKPCKCEMGYIDRLAAHGMLTCGVSVQLHKRKGLLQSIVRSESMASCARGRQALGGLLP